MFYGVFNDEGAIGIFGSESEAKAYHATLIAAGEDAEDMWVGECDEAGDEAY